ncbi:MAG TPA: polyprenyl synthetase family protein [Gemmatimonadaceae bacterium]|jgi:octaprenyl-diphosphate synthase|nr:polyprenyl synthetase family protein [Gemmatimonadaceae bacterium]
MSGAAARMRTPVTGALRDIQAPVRQGLDDVVAEMQRIVTENLPIIREVSAHLLQMRGKMFRPTLALLSSAAAGTPESRGTVLAAVVELMHLATLVHDDSVDHSVLRRGLPTVNSMFSHQVSVIMGDFLYSRALTALVAMGDLEILRIVTNIANELTIGEMRQLAAVETLSFGEDDYYMLIRAKTASLIAGACESGALCGAAEFREPLAHFGDRLGMAFQIADDILDYTEDESVTGKPGGLDLREHKVTLPLIAALPRLNAVERERVEALFRTESPADGLVFDTIAIVEKAGGIEYARRQGERFAREAEAALRGLPPSPVRSALTDSIAYVMERRS